MYGNIVHTQAIMSSYIDSYEYYATTQDNDLSSNAPHEWDKQLLNVPVWSVIEWYQVYQKYEK